MRNEINHYVISVTSETITVRFFDPYLQVGDTKLDVRNLVAEVSREDESEVPDIELAIFHLERAVDEILWENEQIDSLEEAESK